MLRKLKAKVDEYRGTRRQKQVKKIVNAKIFYRAQRLTDYFYGFKHVLVLDTSNLTWTLGPEFADQLFQDIKDYDPGDGSFVSTVMRIRYEAAFGEPGWYFNEFGGGDYPVIATDSDDTAIYFALKYP